MRVVSSLELSDGSAVGSSEIDSEAVGCGAASSFDEEFESAKIAKRTTPAITRKRTPFEFFFAGADGAAAGLEGAGVLVTVVDPRVGTGGITIFVASTFAEDRFATARFEEDFLAGAFFGATLLAGAFFAGRLVDFADFFAADFAGRFAAAFLIGRFADFFFAATTTPSSIRNSSARP